jgi:hypothetical protein
MKTTPILLGLFLASACGAVAGAQDASTPSIPKVIQIQREWIKPGKAGALHDKSESAFVQAMTKAKFPAHYFALNSMSGKSRALYITPYASFEVWEKDNKAVEKNAALASDLENAIQSDGELLDGYDSAVLTYNEDLSYKPRPDMSHARYLEITQFKIRSGHTADFIEATKMVKAAHDKAGTSAHWAAFEIAYGAEWGTYLLLSSDASMTEIDKGNADQKKWFEAMGEEGMKKLDALAASGIESMRSELFSINPKQSYVDEAWIKADPDFWSPKGPQASSSQPEAKPASAAVSKPSSR